MHEELFNKIKEEYEKAEDKVEFLNNLRKFIHELSPFKHNPCDMILWVKTEKVKPNDYNPNVVPKEEFRLLYHSIKKDGITMPIVVFDNGNDTYTIIDGYHRYMCLKTFEDLKELNKGYIPVAVVKGKSRAELMASTIRHNRARGRHQIVRMPNIIAELTNNWDTKTISEELGMDEEEIKRIKLFSGYASLFKNVEYSKSWIPRQVLEVYLKEKGEKID